MKDTITPPRYFIKFYNDIMTGEITAREALVYAIVAEFEANGAQCFISRKELGQRINESEHSAERAVQVLLKAGLLISRRDGRTRYLSTRKR
jgi:predicted transcriptional regulator